MVTNLTSLSSNIKNEFFLYIVTGIFLAFISINFKPEVASGMVIFLLVSISVYLYDIFLLDRDISIPFSRPSTSWVSAIIVGVVGALIFSQVTKGILGMSSVEAFQSTLPAFAQSVGLTFIVWVLAIPFIENMTAIRMTEAIVNKSKGNLFDFFNPILWLVVVMVSAGAYIFHVTVFGMTNTKALLITFLFFATGIIMSIQFREGKQFFAFHVTNNALAFATKS